MTDLEILDQPVVPPTFHTWGQLFIRVWKAALVKGEGKVEYVPKVHKENMSYAIDISILPIAEQGKSVVERSLIQSSKEWSLIQASIQATGTKASDIDQKFVKFNFEPTGKTYVNNSGETKNQTYIRIEKVFASEEECRQDFLADNYDVADSDQPTTDNDPNQGVPAAGQKEFETAKLLLEAAVRSSVKPTANADEAKALVLEKVKASPVMARFFTDDSPEIDDLIAEAVKG